MNPLQLLKFAIGGLWLASFTWVLQRTPALPERDPNRERAVHFRQLDEEEAASLRPRKQALHTRLEDVLLGSGEDFDSSYPCGAPARTWPACGRTVTGFRGVDVDAV